MGDVNERLEMTTADLSEIAETSKKRKEVDEENPTEMVTKKFHQMGDELVLTESFTPREYQTELLEIAMNKNTIACLGTGTGKTFIAVMLIRHLSYQTRGDYDKNAKRTFFLVPTVPLVHQQAEVIRNHTDLKVGEYFGENDAEFQSKDKWIKEFEANNVLVTVAEVFRLIIQHGIMPLSKINLLVIDECHRAVKSHPYREAMKCFDMCEPENQPRILGLTAPLVNGKCKPTQLQLKIDKLEITLRSIVATADDLTELKKYGTDPKEYLVIYQDYENCSVEFKMILQLLYSKIGEFEKYKNLTVLEEDLTFYTQPRKCFSNITQVFRSLGPWCGFHATKMLLKEVNQVSRTEETMEVVLNNLEQILKDICIICEMIFEDDNELNNLFCCVPPKMLKLLEILKETHNKYSIEKNSPFCGIIFVKQRLFAYVINHWLTTLSQLNSEYAFLRTNFVVGHGQQTKVDVISMLHKKQERIIKDFRRKEYNFLIATSVIEEGLDIPKCNVVIRFDLPNDYRAYIQSKGRARAAEAVYIIMSSVSEQDTFIQDLNDFKTIEQVLLNLCNKRTPPTKEEIASYNDDDILPPYMPDKRDGAPRITISSAISLINWYCAKLPCDCITKLTPKWKVKNVRNDPSYGCYCILYLPINSPLKQAVFGPAMKNKRLAKMAAALVACEKLHKLGELDENLMPVGSKVDKYLEELLGDLNQQIQDGITTGKKQSRRIYKKQIPHVLQESLPQPGKSCYCYMIRLKRDPNYDFEEMRKYEDFKEEDVRFFGFLTTKKLPQLCDFSIFTSRNAVKVDVNIELNPTTLCLTDDQLQKVKMFHEYIFSNILPLGGEKLQFNPELSEFTIYIVPVITDCDIYQLDFHLMDGIHQYLNSRLKKLKAKCRNEMKPEFYTKEVVLYPWYKDKGSKDKYVYYYVHEVMLKESPESAFPGEEFKSYIDYYDKKYKTKVTNKKQFLLRVGVLSPSVVSGIKSRYEDQTGKVLLRKRKGNQMKADKRSIKLLPELCLILPIPFTLMKQIYCLPAILYRLSSLIQVEQLRMFISEGTGITLAKVKWMPLEFKNDYITKPHIPDSDCIEERPKKIRLGENLVSKINLDSQGSLDSHPGPSPGVLLNALTLRNANDAVNLERLETMGDSFLKYAVSVFLYCTYKDLDEGKLSVLKSKLIQNSFLFSLAKRKNLQEIIIATKFIHNRNWLLPCYVVNEEEETKKSSGKRTNTGSYTKQRVADKSIADCMEAIIGAYLLTCGPYAALKFMSWLGITVFQDSLSVRNELCVMLGNYFWLTYSPIKQISPSLVKHKFTELEIFEQKIQYTFSEKTYLLEALTHPSYFEHSLISNSNACSYGCYQRLEFIGDAILDYMITRYIYEDPKKHSPGSLTDLRAALVNNHFFATLAVKYDYNKYIQISSSTVFNIIHKFVSKVIEGNVDVQYCCYDIEESEAEDVSEIEVPKVLADVFEAVAGAIYVDSGMSLEAVWKVYYPMLKPGFDNFSKNIPKPPVRQLMELYPRITKFQRPTVLKSGKVKVQVTVGEAEFEGIGPNRIVAKHAAAKRALKGLKKENNN